MALRIERIPTFGDNYTYLVICDETNDAAIIDAPEEDPVVARVDQDGPLPRHQVADVGESVGRQLDHQVPRRVPRRKDEVQLAPLAQVDDLAFVDALVDLEAQASGGLGVSQDRRAPSIAQAPKVADVIAVMVGHQQVADATPLGGQALEHFVEHGALVVVGRGRLDHGHPISGRDQGVGGRGGRQGRRAQGQAPKALAETLRAGAHAGMIAARVLAFSV